MRTPFTLSSILTDNPPHSPDPQTHVEFLSDLLARVNTEASPEAHVLLLATIAGVKLTYGDLEGTRTDMDAAWAVLEKLEGVDNGVNAAYYGLAAEYYQVCGALSFPLASYP